MNLLKTIIERLNQRVEVANIFDKQFNLCELNANGNDKAWVHYIGNGQAEVVTNFDAKNGTLFWAKRGKVTVAKTDAYKMSGCKQLYVTTFPLTAYAIVRKSHLPCDAEDAQDWLASRVYKLTSGTDPLFKQSIGVINYEVVPSGYANEIKTLTANYEWACVSVDMDVQVITTSEDGCYDTCATGDIPLPDLQPCTPCLTEVAVDGVTITGNGTPADPLVAVGGEGGAIAVEDEGVEVTPIATTLNFVGEGVTASLTSPGVVEINIPGGTGDVGTLQEVTDLGNSTTNDIDFIANAGLSFDNGAFFRKGTTDAGNGGAKGTAQICSISYELKWEAGRLYYMEQDGFTIRDVTHNFTFIPQVTDDSTKGFVAGSRWSLDDGTVYLCSDATIGAAVWAVVSVGGVTSVSGTAPIASSGGATPAISISQASTSTDGYLSQTDWDTFNGKFNVPTGLVTDYLDGLGTPTPFPAIPVGTVTSVNSGININVDNTNPAAPIINSLADRYKTSSTTSNSVSNGSKNFTVDVNLSYIPLQEILVVFDPAHHMHGEVTSYNPATGALVVDIKTHTGSGTYTSWVLNLDGTPVDALTGSGTANEIAYFTGSRVLASLPIATYPSLTELSYVKGVTSAIQTQINGKQATITPAALTKVDDTNVTLTLGGTPTTALLQGVSITAGWSGTLADIRIASAATWNAKQDAITLTTTGTSGAATLTGATLNIPQYSGGGGSNYKSTTDTAGYTGNTNTAVFTQLIAANTYAIGDILRVTYRTRKTGGNGNQTLRIYVNATADLTGTPILIGGYQNAGANSFLVNQMIRHLAIKSSTNNTEVYLAAGTATATDYGLYNSATTCAIDWTTNKYFVFAIQSTSLTDTNYGSMYLIEKL